MLAALPEQPSQVSRLQVELLVGWRQSEACKQGLTDQVRTQPTKNLVDIVIIPFPIDDFGPVPHNELLSDPSRICLVLLRKRKTAFLPVLRSAVLVLTRSVWTAR
jgi:hypothetical protein